MKLRYRRNKGRCLTDCIAIMFDLPREKAFDPYKTPTSWIRHLREWGKERSVMVGFIDEGLNQVLAPGYHIRIGKSVCSGNSKKTHACVYFGNTLIYDPNDAGGTISTGGLMPNSLTMLIVFEGLIIEEDPLSLL